MRILVVEDDPKMRAVLVQGLAESDFEVEAVGAGPEALACVAAGAVDAVVLDLMLPGGMDGFEVCLQVRRRGSKVPILMLTARDSVGDRVRGLDTGADDYLAKPFAFEELLARLRAILRRPAPPPTARVLTVADLEMDLDSREVRRAGSPIDLTPREFALLEYLLRNKGVTVTKSMILDRVWDFEYDDGSNVVPVYVNYLRRKVDQGLQPKLIHTVRGVGYVLKERA